MVLRSEGEEGEKMSIAKILLIGDEPKEVVREHIHNTQTKPYLRLDDMAVYRIPSAMGELTLLDYGRRYDVVRPYDKPKGA